MLSNRTFEPIHMDYDTRENGKGISYLNIMRAFVYSHSIVDGGLLVMS